eukprot:Nitzschia sp. Nitz4//scaffold146_size56529//31852//35685//NITZ4_006578-RA/size56529-processed-gene-0.62-mRNA-1//-1//CDS//3329536641//3022//frame0
MASNSTTGHEDNDTKDNNNHSINNENISYESNVAVLIGPETPPSHIPVSPDVITSMHGKSLIASSAIRHVQRVSKQAALNTKKQIWDSNDASIVAAQSAVDQWEQGYNGLRHLLCALGGSAQGLYGAAKAGVTGLEHTFLQPVRDWVLLPAFGGLEKVAGETVGFLQSDHARHLAGHSLELAKQVPFVGENILAPVLCIGADALQKTWHVVQYPIPSPSQVRDSVDFVMTGTKWALSNAGREVFLYIKRADANITRTLSHTQWKVLGSGPYATLDKLNKRQVIDHLCERYFSLAEDMVARYELAAHIRIHNRPLYHDLVLTGLLRERGGDLTADDEWLSPCPTYREESETPFLLGDQGDPALFALWFRLPNENGKRPRQDTPWVMMDELERRKLEQFFRMTKEAHENDQASLSCGVETREVNPLNSDKRQQYVTTAKWYNADPINDLFLDQRRYAVTFYPCCPKCRLRHDYLVHPPRAPKKFGELCDMCTQGSGDAPWVDTLLSPPPMVAVYRPTMWRFYGPGDELRRSNWFLDTHGNGLQPYGGEAQAILEDAYLFLKWAAGRREWDESLLLTVQVQSPDGSEQQLVQFSSLTSATAIGKGLGSAIKLFKRRVYRGAYFGRPTTTAPVSEDSADVPKPNDTTQVDSPVAEHPKEEDAEDLSVISEEETDADVESANGNHGELPDEIKSRLSLDSGFSGPLDEPDAILDPELDQDTSVLNIVTQMDVLPDDVKSRLSLDSPTSTSFNEADPSLETALSPPAIPRSVDDSHELSEADLNEMVDLAETAVVDAMTLYSDEIKSLQLRLSQPANQRLLLAYPFKASEEPKEDKLEDTDKIDHLVLIVHGIGEMLRSIDLFGVSKLPTIVDCCGYLRKNHSKVLEVHTNELFKKLDGISIPLATPGRVEYLPIEWHDSFTIQSQRRVMDSSNGTRNYTIDDISLRTIPQIRQFANDTLMDVLFFVSPEHHDVIVNIVVSEMNFVVQRFRALTGFTGNVSLVGHSLGSIIAWDILDNQRGFQDSLLRRDSYSFAHGSSRDKNIDSFSGAGADGEDESNESSHSNFRFSLAQPMYPQLNFKVDNAFMLGSPIAVFLMIRNQQVPLTADYKLGGCDHIFNIFHPFDPVAYRIEPLLDPRNAEIEAKIMAHWHGGYRFQYQTKLLWKRIVEETVKTQENAVALFESGMSALGLLDGIAQEGEEDDVGVDGSTGPHTVVAGALNRGHRIDYMLQEKELETANEYVAALAAHSCYWLEKDLSLFIARQISSQALDRRSKNSGAPILP